MSSKQDISGLGYSVVWFEVSAPSVGFKEHQPSDVSHLLTLIARTCHYTPLPVPQLNQEGQDRKVVFSINYVITFGCPERSYKEAIKEAKCYAATNTLLLVVP